MKQLLLITVLFGLTAAQGFQKRGMMGQGHSFRDGGHMLNPEILASAGLNEEQINRIKSIHSKTEKEAIQLQADLKVLNLEKGELLISDNMDMNKIESKIKSINELRGKMEMNRIRSMAEVKNVLSKEQWAKLKEMRKDRGESGQRGRMKRKF
ncbi:MAG: periplasmic heavy metal sensor [Calditrichaeota bacterium]|nr:periplasmic heavy metal sensor [Calditrichota bacterium]